MVRDEKIDQQLHGSPNIGGFPRCVSMQESVRLQPRQPSTSSHTPPRELASAALPTPARAGFLPHTQSSPFIATFLLPLRQASKQAGHRPVTSHCATFCGTLAEPPRHAPPPSHAPGDDEHPNQLLGSNGPLLFPWCGSTFLFQQHQSPNIWFWFLMARTLSDLVK
jgi:hypothetical protein